MQPKFETIYIKPQSTWGRIVRFNNTNNKIATNNSANRIEWAQLVGETNYWAGWIMDNNSPDFKAFSSSPEFLPSPSSVNKFKIREIAAWGWDFPCESPVSGLLVMHLLHVYNLYIEIFTSS